MIDFEIIKLQTENERLRKELEQERALNKSALETLKECVHKDRLKELREIDNIDYLQYRLKVLLGE